MDIIMNRIAIGLLLCFFVTANAATNDDAEKLKSCRKTFDAKKAEYDQLSSEKKFWKAAAVFRSCSSVWPNTDLKKLTDDAEIKEHQSVIKDPKAKKEDKLRAMERLVIDYPDIGKQYEKTVSRADQAERSKQLSHLKNKGVTLGMSAEEVRASSWGRPKSVNTTTGAYGTHEQWVYGGQNYLYFENGRLTTIQN